MVSGAQLRRLLAWCWHCLALAVIAAAVLLTLVRLALPWLSSYRGELERGVSEYVEAPVAIGGLAVEWRRLGPQLELTDVRVGEGPRAALHFGRAVIDLALGWDGGFRVPLRIEGIELAGLDVRARVDNSGRIHWRAFTLGPIADLDGGSGASAGEVAPGRAALPDGLDWLLSVDEISLHDIRIQLDTPEGGRELGDTELRLVNSATQHRFALRSAGLGDDPGRLRVTALVEQPEGRDGPWRWRAYAASEGLEVAPWHALTRIEAMAGCRGKLSGEVWLSGAGWRPQRALADARVDGLELRSPATDNRFAADRLSGRWQWQRRPSGWRVRADDVVLERAGRAWPATRLGVEYAASGDGPGRFDVRASFLDLADVAAASRLVALPDWVGRRLATHRPHGQARDVALRWAGDDASALSFQARFDDLGWQPSEDVPGVTGVDAHVRGDAEGATLEVATQAGQVRMPRLFRAPMRVAHADGRVRFAYGDEGVRIASDRLELANADVAASARFALRAGPEQRPAIDLVAAFGEGDLSALSRYLPVKDMDPEAVEWLDRGLRSGRVANGTALWRGPIADFPYRDNEGHFSVGFDVAEAEVAFDPEWPAVRDGGGHVRLEGPALTVEGDRGRFLGGTVGDLRVHFDDLDRPFVDVAARGPLPMADVIRLATETPLREELGEAFRGATGSGTVHSELRLTIPLDNVDDADVEGRFRVEGAALRQPRFGLDLTEIRGTGAFDDDGVAIEGMRARHKGQPVEIAARPSREPRPRVVFSLSGALTPRELLPDDAHTLARCCNGRSPWRVEARVPTGDNADAHPVIVTARSRLAGTAVRIPTPFAKPAARSRRLETRLRIAPDSDRARIWLDYGGDIRGVFQLVGAGEAARVTRSTIRFGTGDPSLADEPGMRLAGRIDRLHVRSWLDWLGQGGDAADEPEGLRVTHADLAIERARYGALEATDVTARARRQGDTIRLELASGALAGELEIPTWAAADRTLRGRFERVDLVLLRPDDWATADDTGQPPGVADVPPLDVRADRLKLAHGTLRDGVLVTRPTRSGQRIHRLGFDTAGLSLRADGRWRGDGEGAGRTQLNLKLDGDDYGRGLAAFGFGSVLDGGSGETRAQLSWPGAPWAPRLRGLRGHTELRLEQGRLEQLDVGPARILGLFSLDAGGFLRSGFSFDKIDGRIEFAEGNAYMRDVAIVGGPGRIRVRGRTGLIARDYDQRVFFQPQISGSLTALGLLSGGPVAGLGVALLQQAMKALGADVDKATEFEYRLTGSWADPNVRLVNPEPAEPESDERGQRGRDR